MLEAVNVETMKYNTTVFGYFNGSILIKLNLILN